MSTKGRVVSVSIDGTKCGTVSLPLKATERSLVLIATRKLPKVLERLKKRGIAAAEWIRTASPAEYKIYTTLPAEVSLALSKENVQSKKPTLSPYRALGIPHLVNGKLLEG